MTLHPKNSLPITCLACLFLITACNKVPEKWRVHTEYRQYRVVYEGKEQVNNITTDTFYYDKDGNFDPAPKGQSVTEKRDGNIVERKIRDKAGNIVSQVTIYYNKQGYDDSTIVRTATGDVYRHKYLYDAEGNMIEDRQYDPQPPMHIWKYTVENGNRIREEFVANPGTDTVVMVNPVTLKNDTVVTTYDAIVVHKEYYTDKLRMPANEHTGSKDRDFRSKNLEKRAVQLSTTGDTMEVYDFKYTYDGKGRVITAVQVSRSGAEYDSTAYTYY